MTEKAIILGPGRGPFGILTLPDRDPDLPEQHGVILLNAGTIPHFGPNRIYVALARQFGRLGLPALRLDFSGVGEGLPKPGNEDVPLETRHFSEVQDAMDYLGRWSGVRKFFLLGICSGADMALNVGCSDRRVKGVILINGSFVPSDVYSRLEGAVLASAKRRFRRRKLLRPRSWMHLLKRRFPRRGGIGAEPGLPPPVEKVDATGPHLRHVTDRTWKRFKESGLSAYLLFSEGSSNLDLFRLYHAALLAESGADGGLEIEICEGADHTFTPLWSQEFLMARVLEWCGRIRGT